MNKKYVLEGILLPAVKVGIIVAGADIMHSLFFGYSMTKRSQFISADTYHRRYDEFVKSPKRYSGTGKWEEV